MFTSIWITQSKITYKDSPVFVRKKVLLSTFVAYETCCTYHFQFFSCKSLWSNNLLLDKKTKPLAWLFYSLGCQYRQSKNLKKIFSFCRVETYWIIKWEKKLVLTHAVNVTATLGLKIICLFHVTSFKRITHGGSISILTSESYHYALSREMAQGAWGSHHKCAWTLRPLDR